LILNAAQLWKENILPPLSLKAIICTADTLQSFQIKFIESVFRCPVIMEYGCSETDIIAFQCEYRNYHIISENVFLEYGNGNSGNIIITDLNNKIMPLIRYRIGDYGARKDEECKCGRPYPIISDIQGRSADRYIKLESGEKKHAVVFAHVFEEIVKKGFEIKQFKVTQKALNCLELQIDIANDRSVRKDISRALSKKLNDVFGNRMKLDFKFGKIQHIRGQKFSYFQPLTD
jgi:phenylacetate-CoA ligase